jgi:hypothetical protein
MLSFLFFKSRYGEKRKSQSIKFAFLERKTQKATSPSKAK